MENKNYNHTTHPDANFGGLQQTVEQAKGLLRSLLGYPHACEAQIFIFTLIRQASIIHLKATHVSPARGDIDRALFQRQTSFTMRYETRSSGTFPVAGHLDGLLNQWMCVGRILLCQPHRRERQAGPDFDVLQAPPLAQFKTLLQIPCRRIQIIPLAKKFTKADMSDDGVGM